MLSLSWKIYQAVTNKYTVFLNTRSVLIPFFKKLLILTKGNSSLSAFTKNRIIFVIQRLFCYVIYNYYISENCRFLTGKNHRLPKRLMLYSLYIQCMYELYSIELLMIYEILTSVNDCIRPFFLQKRCSVPHMF